MSQTGGGGTSVLAMLKVSEIRNKILITLGLLACYRVGFKIPLPGVNYEAFGQPNGDGGLAGLFDIMNVLTGAQLQSASLFSLGVMPYISASIIFSLMTKVVPSLEKLSKEGATGQRKINQYTRYATVPICIVQAAFVLFGRLFADSGSGEPILQGGIADTFGSAVAYSVVVIVSVTAGTLFIMWLGEQITEHGIGNGVSLIIMAGIVAGLFEAFLKIASTESGFAGVWQTLLLFLGAWVVAVVAVVYITKAIRPIPIKLAKQMRGRSVYGGQNHSLPLKVIHAGVMPIIFASAMLIVPVLIGQATGWSVFLDFQRHAGFWYITCFATLIFFFSFFWASLMFQPNEIADNLKEHGSFIPGIRPGANTATFLEETMMRITLAGAAFLSIVAVFPSLVSGQFQGLDTTLIYFMSGTSILIVVSVALDLVEKLNALLIMRNYDGFMKDPTGATDAAAGAAAGDESGRGWGRSRA